MDIQVFIDSALSFLRGNPIIAIVLGLGLLYLMIKMTKLFLYLLCLVLLVAGGFFVIKEMAGGGTAAKSQMINKGSPQEGR